MTDPARHRHGHHDSNTDQSGEDHVSEADRRTNDTTKQVYGAYDDPEGTIRNSDPGRTDGASMFELDGGVETSSAVQDQPTSDGVGPFSTPLILVVVALVIFVALLVILG